MAGLVHRHVQHSKKETALPIGTGYCRADRPGDTNTLLMCKIADALTGRPDWDRSPADVKDMARRISDLVTGITSWLEHEENSEREREDQETRSRS
jgi:hypothetical protein